MLEWFETHGEGPDPTTGMWIVKPEIIDNKRSTSFVSVDTIVRSCHLLPVFGAELVPHDFHFSHSLDAYDKYYVNHFVDNHAFELLNI